MVIPVIKITVNAGNPSPKNTFNQMSSVLLNTFCFLNAIYGCDSSQKRPRLY
jgi:hypothetical protein